MRPFDIWLDEGYGYYLTTHPEDLSNEAVALFRSWLIARFAAEREKLEEAVGDAPRSGGEIVSHMPMPISGMADLPPWR